MHKQYQVSNTTPESNATDARLADYKLRLAQPDFWNTPNPEMEERLLAHWQDTHVNKVVAEHRKDAQTYWLLDGPPYANGDAHLGHLLNKTLKDVNARFQSALGKKVVWRSGWDCHGLPLELAVEKRYGAESKSDPLSFMAACREEASSWQSAQAKTMQRLGLLANFEQPWLTMDPQREASALDLLRQLWVEGLLVERQSPVHWCPACQSALAASELEKSEKTRQEAYFLAELTPDSVQSLYMHTKHSAFSGQLNVLAWTTTPWTVFANTAFAHPEKGAATVVTFKSGKKALMAVAARDEFYASYPHLVEDAGHKTEGLLDFADMPLLRLSTTSPMSGRPAPLVHGTFVSSEDGSGFVHVAPAFGPEDFDLHENNNVELVCHVGTNGRLMSTNAPYGTLPEGFENLTLDAASVETVAWLENNKYLVHTYETTVEQQMCWRHKKAVFYRASQQWALDLEKPFTGCPEGLAARATQALQKTTFVPDDRAKTPLLHMLATRRFWTLSRDRVWGLPLPFYRNKETGQLHPETDAMWSELCAEVKVQGVEAWVRRETPSGYTKSHQVVDVWFDSGSAWHHASEEGLSAPDLGVEGRDQTRGWFLSSFLLHAFKSDEPAFKTLMTHSFVVGENGLKLSKSSGGGGAALDPAAVFKKEGADAFRMWVCAQNVGDESKWGKTALKQATQDVKDWRSFLRYLLANMAKAVNETCPVDLSEMDRLALSKAAQARDNWCEHMQAGRFNQALQELNGFRLWASTEWFELGKRMLYCAADSDSQLRSMQWSLQEVFVLFTRMLAVVMPFAAEEAYQAWANHPDSSVFLGVLPHWNYGSVSPTLPDALAWRKCVLPLVEKARSFVEKGTPVTVAFNADSVPKVVTSQMLRDWFGTCYATVGLPLDAFEDHVTDESLGVVAGRSSVDYKPYRCARCRTYYRNALNAEGLCTQCETELM